MKILSPFHHLQLRGQLFLSCTMLMFLWLVIFALDSAHRVETMVGNQVKMSQEANLMQTSNQLTYHMQEMKRLSDILLLNHAFQEQTPYYASRPVPVTQLLDETEHFFRQKEFLENVRRVYAAYDIRVYLDDGMLYAREGVSFFPESEISDQPWFNRLPVGKTAPIWVTLDAKVADSDSSPVSESRLSLVRRLIVNGMTETIGVLTVSMLPNTGNEMLVSSFGDLGGALYLLDGDDRCVISSIDAPPLPSGIVQATQPMEHTLIDTPNGKWLALRNKLSDSNFSLLSLVPREIVQKSSRNMRNASLITLLLVALFTLVLINFISQRLSFRIRELARSMTDVGGGTFSGEVKVHANDEIGMIEHKLNAMSQQLSQVVSEIHVSEKRKREAELRALQAQINPHFLYNTLDTINWMAMDIGAVDISSMAVALGTFFRKSLSGGEDVITLKEEMEITKLYVDIQQMRMGKKLDITYDVPDEVLQLKTIKLLIQPLVENAVKHGFGGLKEQAGHIHIAISRKGDMLNAQVSNDGLGLMDEKSAHRHARSGYGLKNIVERLKLHFGEDSDLTLSPGEGDIGAIVQITWRAHF